MKKESLRNYSFYFNAIDQSVPLKYKLIAPWIDPNKDKTIIDFGSGSGQLAFKLAQTFPSSKIIGVDNCLKALRWANQKYKGKTKKDNLVFTYGDIGDLKQQQKKADVIIACSVLHEIYSRSEKTLGHVREALISIWDSLNRGGKIIIRDFVAPERMQQQVIFKHYKEDIVPGHSFSDFLEIKGFPLYAQVNDEDYITYHSTLQAVYEYIYRKDYHVNWKQELDETYGFWTGRTAKQFLKHTGFKIEYYAELDNSWIERNRLDGKVQLINYNTYFTIPYPKYQMIVVARKK